MAQHYYSKNCSLLLYKFKGLKSKFLSIPQRLLPFKNVKSIYLTTFDMIFLISMPAHHLSTIYANCS